MVEKIREHVVNNSKNTMILKPHAHPSNTLNKGPVKSIKPTSPLN